MTDGIAKGLHLKLSRRRRSRRTEKLKKRNREMKDEQRTQKRKRRKEMPHNIFKNPFPKRLADRAVELRPRIDESGARCCEQRARTPRGFRTRFAVVNSTVLYKQSASKKHQTSPVLIPFCWFPTCFSSASFLSCNKTRLSASSSLTCSSAASTASEPPKFTTSPTN